MNLDRFTRIVEAYGTRPEQWPVDEREAAIDFARDHEDARALLAEYAALDDWLDSAAANERAMAAQLQSRLLASLPTQAEPARPLLDRFIDWLLPASMNPAEWFRPALVAALPLVAGIMLSGTLATAVNFDTAGTSDDSWDDQVYLLSLAAEPVGLDDLTTPSVEVNP